MSNDELEAALSILAQRVDFQQSMLDKLLEVSKTQMEIIMILADKAGLTNERPKLEVLKSSGGVPFKRVSLNPGDREQ